MIQILRDASTAFVLDESKSPHMTVYMARFPSKALAAVVEGVESAVRMIGSFRCQHAGYLMTEGRYLEASYRKTPERWSSTSC